MVGVASPGFGGAAIAQHHLLRGQYFRQRPLHKNNPIFVTFGKCKQKARDHFHGLALAFANAGRVLRKLLYAFPLEIASRIIRVSLPLPIGEYWHSTRRQHCIISEVPERGSPETVVIMNASACFLLRNFQR
jgi:hypothetical protein